MEIGVSEAAELLGISMVAVRQAVRSGRLPATVGRSVRGRRQWLFSETALEGYRRSWQNRDEGLWSVQQIADHCLVSYGRVQRALKKWDVPAAAHDGKAARYKPETADWLAEHECWPRT